MIFKTLNCNIAQLSMMFALALILFFSSCQPPNATPPTDTAPNPTSTTTPEAPKPTNRIPDGKWVSADDKLSSLVVKGEYVYDYYDKEKLDSTKYTISKESCNASNEKTKKVALYLLWHDDMCYEIVGLTDDYLELIYLDRGNTLTYHRVK